VIGTSLLWSSTAAFTYLKVNSTKRLCLLPVVLVLVLRIWSCLHHCTAHITVNIESTPDTAVSRWYSYGIRILDPDYDPEHCPKLFVFTTPTTIHVEHRDPSYTQRDREREREREREAKRDGQTDRLTDKSECNNFAFFVLLVIFLLSCLWWNTVVCITPMKA